MINAEAHAAHCRMVGIIIMLSVRTRVRGTAVRLECPPSSTPYIAPPDRNINQRRPLLLISKDEIPIMLVARRIQGS